MVIFAVPFVAALFTGLIGGVGIHIIKRNHNTDQNNQQNQQPNKQNSANEGEYNQAQGIQLINQSSQKQKDSKEKDIKKNSGQLSSEGKQEEEQKKEEGNIESWVVQSEKKFTCPLTHKIMKQPAELLCGHCFQKQNLIQALRKSKKCPICERKARGSDIFIPVDFKDALDTYKEKKRARKLSRERLIQDFGDDKFQFNALPHQMEKSHSDTEYPQIKITTRASQHLL